MPWGVDGGGVFDVGADGAAPELLVGMLAVITMLASVLVFLVRTYSQTRAVNKAVNNVGEDEHTLINRVTHMGENVAKLVEAQEDFTGVVGGRCPRTSTRPRN